MVRASDLSLNDTRELQDSTLHFPTSNQPVLDTALKDMLADAYNNREDKLMWIKAKLGDLENCCRHNQIRG